ncbi:MAG: NUDIX hydrolase N-terminal domain-containing protein [Ardenticatenaceae bacterium]|nr:NUDIX hydrolase N-terminal domain-containing protein [Ardenticatenaceae bacterium]
MTPAQQLALWADRLRDMSAMGLRFSDNIYDRSNYRAIQTIAMEMLALATGQPLAEIETLRAPIFSRPTPITVADAAIIDDEGKILLIRQADNQLWAMPGGALSVGETPAEGAVREAFEETGARAEAVALVGVHDSRLCGTLSRHHLYHFLFLCKPMNGSQVAAKPSHDLEVLDAAWFAENDLPPDIDPGHAGRILDAFRVWHGDRRAYFDR